MIAYKYKYKLDMYNCIDIMFAEVVQKLTSNITFIKEYT